MVRALLFPLVSSAFLYLSLSLSLFLPLIFVLSLPSSLYNMLYYFLLLLLYSYSTRLKILLRIPRIIPMFLEGFCARILIHFIYNTINREALNV